MYAPQTCKMARMYCSNVRAGIVYEFLSIARPNNKAKIKQTKQLRVIVQVYLFDPFTSQSTAMVMPRRSVHLTTRFHGQA